MNNNKQLFEKAGKFIYRNARPIELALWRYHFENGSKEDVLTALAAYQNEDGGFGHALEADCFNPNSCPIQTWDAAEILKEIDFKDGAHPIIKGILRYLDSGADFSEKYGQWLSSVKSNEKYPHAIWWNYSDQEKDFCYNPTAHLAGFILRVADKDSSLYKKGEKIALQAYDWFKAHVPFGDNHTTACFVSLYDYLSEAGTELVDMEEFKGKLIEEVNFNICRDIEKWKTDYVCKPSKFIQSKDSMFYKGNEELVEKECELIVECQLEDGSFIVPWTWCNEYKEFPLAENWWKSVFIVNNLRFVKSFC
ncbi:MAG: hypothetical protein HDT44_07415 [Ruminococcaceae bacterium]|nr:hypothetical protein [Oscillospiraceae bacterium]